MKNLILAITAWIIFLLLAFPTFIAMSLYFILLGKEVIQKYLLRVAVGIDQAGSSILNWNEDMTISGHIGYRILHNKATLPERLLCRFLRKLEVNHCIKAIEQDEISTEDLR